MGFGSIRASFASKNLKARTGRAARLMYAIQSPSGLLLSIMGYGPQKACLQSGAAVQVLTSLSVLGKLDGKLEVSSVNGWPKTVSRMSAAARRRISIAQKARWAKMRTSPRWAKVKG